MQIAYTIAPTPGDTDLVLYRVAKTLIARGVKTCGTVQINTECEGQGPCDMDVRVLPDGPVIRISQSLGKAARGCRLDASELEKAVGLVKAELEKGADILVINKFGKQEADGRGFREVIADALARDIPVLVGLNKLNQPAFETFAGGLATAVAPSVADLTDWAQVSLGLEAVEA